MTEQNVNPTSAGPGEFTPGNQPGAPPVPSDHSPASLGGGLQQGGQQIGGSRSPAGDLDEEDDIELDEEVEVE